MDVEKGEIELHPTTKQFVALIELAATKCLNFVSDEDFTESYKKLFVGYEIKEGASPLLSGSSREAIRLRETFNKQVMTHVKNRVEDFLEDAHLDEKLRELDQLKTEQSASKNKQAWRPPGDALKHMKSVNLVAKMNEKARLQAVVAREREQLKLLQTKVAERRKKSQELEKSLDEKQKRMENAIASVKISE